MVEGPATDAAFAVVFLVLGGLIAVGLAVIVSRLLTGRTLLGEAAECTASRDANITASISQPCRRTIVIPIPAESIISVSPGEPMSPGTDYAVPRPADIDAIRANSITYDLASLTAPAVPELPPVVVLVVEEEEDEQGIPVDWPTRIVQPVPLRGEALL